MEVKDLIYIKAHLPPPSHRHTYTYRRGRGSPATFYSPFPLNVVSTLEINGWVRKLTRKKDGRDLPILGSLLCFCSDYFPHPGMPRLERLGHLCQDFGVTGDHLMTFWMDILAQKDSGKGLAEGGLRLEKELLTSWKTFGHKSPQGHKWRLVCATQSSQPSSHLPFFSLLYPLVIFPISMFPKTQAGTQASVSLVSSPSGTT